MLSYTFLDFISDVGVTDQRHCMIDKIKNKIEGLHLQQCSLKNRSLRKLAVSPKALFFSVTVFICSIMEI